MTRSVVFDVIAHDRASAAFKSAASSAERSAGRINTVNSRLKTLAKTAAVAAGTAALGGIVAVFKTGAEEQSDFLKGQAQLAAGLKSTHNVARTSVGAMESLASSIQAYSGQTDDSIVASESLLLTFTNIRNAAGKNNDIFDQATKITADMAARMGGPASSYAIKLGKALNDPVKGMTALTRIGVQFDAGQQKQIKSMVAAGNTIGAQKVILAELNKEFGGSARAAGQTLPGQLARARRSFEDVSQSVVAALMPALTGGANMLSQHVIPAFKSVVGFFTGGSTAAKILGGAIAGLTGILLVHKIGTLAVSAATKVSTVATKAWAAATWLLNIAMRANPIMLVVAALAVLAAGLIYAYKHSETFRNVIAAVWAGLLGFFRAVWGFLKSWGPLILAVLAPVIGIPLLIWQHWSQITGYVQSAWDSTLKFIKKIPGAIVGVFASAAKNIGGIGTSIITWIGNAASTAWTTVVKFFQGLPHQVGIAIANYAGAAWNWAKNLGKTVINTLRDGAAAVLTGLVGFFAGLPHRIGVAIANYAGAAWNWAAGIGKSIINGFKNGAAAVLSGLIGWFAGLPHSIGSAIANYAGRAWAWASGIGTNIVNTIKNGASAAVTAVLGFFGGLPHNIGVAIANYGGKAWNWAVGIGKNILAQIGAGLAAAARSVLDFFKDLPGNILKWLGISSPPKWAVSAGKWIIMGLLKGIKGNVGAVLRYFGTKVIDALKSVAGGFIPGGPQELGGGSGNRNAFYEYAKSLMPTFGWNPAGPEWSALWSLWQGESNWNPAARNPESGAYGIPQAWPPGKLYEAGRNINDAATQIRWGLKYISTTYGSPSRAYAFWLAHMPHWYGTGLPPTFFRRPTLIGVGDYPGGETVTVARGRTGGASVVNNYYYITIPTVTAASADDGRRVGQALERYVGQGGKVHIARGVA